MFRYTVLLCLVSLIWSSQTQDATAAQQSAQASKAVIDGSKTPEQIPDAVAWLMLFKTIADSPTAPDHQTRAAFIRDAGFTDEEIEVVLSTANEAMTRVREMENTIIPSSLNADLKTQKLRSQRDMILTDVVHTLLARLSPEAAEKFRKHIDNRVKRDIKIIP